MVIAILYAYIHVVVIPDIFIIEHIIEYNRGRAVFRYRLRSLRGLFEGAVYSKGANYSRKYGSCVVL